MAGMERLLDEEMKHDDAPTTPSTCGSASAPASADISGSESNARSTFSGSSSRRGSATETTWNFVQMNMTLLPIARPLPVSVPSRMQDGLTRKPSTPNQKLHRRVLRNASNISPRHHEDTMLRRRSSTSSEHGTAACTIPRPTVPARQVSAPSSSHCGKRARSDHDDHYLSSSWQSSSMFYRLHINGDEESRARSASEDILTTSTTGDERLDEGCVLIRSASTSAAFAHRGALFKDKRILEIQDEERWLVPNANERAGLASPSKRSRRA
jgi:hypothetical protein